jgi:hypothetical protein
MTKAEARQHIDGLGLPPDQAAAAYRTIKRATASEKIEIVLTKSSDLIVTRTRPGRVGYQVFEDTIRPAGGKSVVQRAYDDQGRLVHDDPKGGTP